MGKTYYSEYRPRWLMRRESGKDMLLSIYAEMVDEKGKWEGHIVDDIGRDGQ